MTEAEKGLLVIREVAKVPDQHFMGVGPESRRLMGEFLKQYDEVCRMIECLHDVPSYVRRLEDATRRGR